MLLLFSACKKGGDPKAPEESYNQTEVKHERKLSVINIPVEISMSEVERQINNQLKALIYEDSSLTDNGGDNFLIKVWKKNNITVNAQADIFHINVPLKIWARGGYAFKELGLDIKQFKETDFEINVKFATKVALDNNWKVTTITSPNGFEWVTKPVIKFGPITLPLSSIVGNIIDEQQGKMAKMIDQQVKDKVNIKPEVQRAWNLVQTPLLISSAYNTWLKITPVEILMTPLQGQGTKTRALLGIKAYTETVTGSKPVVKPNTTIPALQLTPTVPDDFQIGLTGEVSHEYATKAISDKFVGEKYSFKNGKYNVEITSIDLYGSGDNLVIKAGLKGSINGNIYLKGKPYYDATTQSLSLANLDYDLDTKNKVVKTASWLGQGRFIKLMQDAFKVPLKNQLDEAKKTIQANLTNNKVAKGVLLNGTLVDLAPEHVYITPTSIVAVVLAKGKLDVKIEGL